jgi:peptidoglycan/xylan/chitin deacetylase (PgdA/CDA1 family)
MGACGRSAFDPQRTLAIIISKFVSVGGLAALLGGCAVSPASPALQAAQPSAHPAEEIVLPYAPPAMKVLIPPSLPPAKPRVVLNGSRTERAIALTFDACSTRQPSHYDERVTKVLVERGVRATVFLGGKWVEENADHARYLASLPQFELGNHTFLHPHLTRVSDMRIREEIAWTQAAIYTVTGRQPVLFRAPYGEYDQRVIQLAAEAGLTTIQYDVASGDPDVHFTKEMLISQVLQHARAGSIVVMHINRRGWHTAEALPGIIDELRARGFAIVTVGELLAKIAENSMPED